MTVEPEGIEKTPGDIASETVNKSAPGPSMVTLWLMFIMPYTKLITCGVLKSAEKFIVSPGAATQIASLKEQSALHTASLVSCVVVTVQLAARTLATLSSRHAQVNKIVRVIWVVMLLIAFVPLGEIRILVDT